MEGFGEELCRTQQGVRNSFWKDLGWSCDAAGDEKKFLQDLEWICDAREGEKQFLIGFWVEL